MLSLVIAVATSPVPGPQTVNGQSLGATEEFAFVGPGTVCFGDASIELAGRETAYLEYSGIHSLRILIKGPTGELKLSLGDAWAKPRGRQRTIFEDTNSRAVQVTSGKQIRYLLYGKTNYSDGALVPSIWVTGSALAGQRTAEILRRVELSHSPERTCDIRYAFGWGVILEGEPIVTRKAKPQR